MESHAYDESMPNAPPEAAEAVQPNLTMRDNKDLLFVLLFFPLLAIFSLAI